MRVLIAEDESLAAERLRALLTACDPECTIVNEVDSVEDLTAFFKEGRSADVLLLDIQLADGKSFEAFNKVNIEVPVIFTTAYDQYALEAFKQYSVDYLLKPIQQPDLARALQKLKKFAATGARTITSEEWKKLQATLNGKRFKERFLIKSGTKLHFKTTEEVAYFFAEGKEAYLVTRREGRKYLIESTLEELEQSLDPSVFFRISRKHIVSITSIQEVKGSVSTRLEIKLSQPAEHEFTVSRERAQNFKRWLNQDLV